MVPPVVLETPQPKWLWVQVRLKIREIVCGLYIVRLLVIIPKEKVFKGSLFLAYIFLNMYLFHVF